MNHELMPAARKRPFESESLRRKSRRLQGVHRLRRDPLVQVDSRDDRQSVAELQAEQDPTFENRPQLRIALPE
jgi:hypothetical protein